MIDVFIDNGLTGSTYEKTVNLSFLGYEMSGDIYMVGAVWSSIKSMKSVTVLKKWYFKGE